MAVFLPLSKYGHTMVLTPFEYSVKFPSQGRLLSAKTIIRRCEKGMLPSGHVASKLSGGWVIEIPDETIEEKKTAPIETGRRSLNRVHYSL